MLKVTNSRLKPEHRPDNTINPVNKRIANISKAQEMLGFQPIISLEKGLKELYKWYLEIKGEVY